MLVPDTIAVTLVGQFVGSLGERVIETADPLTEPVRLPLSAPYGPMAYQVPDRLLPVCETVTRAGPLPPYSLLVMVPLQLPWTEAVDGPVGDVGLSPLQAETIRARATTVKSLTTFAFMTSLQSIKRPADRDWPRACPQHRMC